MKKNNLLLASIVMLVFTIISKLSGFLREQVFAYFYGVSEIADAYIAATSISTILFGGITVAVATSYIPSIASNKDISKTTSNIINTVMIVILSVSVFATVFADSLIPFVADGFSPEKRAITAEMARIILPFSFIYAISNILSGFLQFKNTFWTIGVSVVINNFVCMIAFAVSNQNLSILALGFAFSWIMPAIFFFVVAIKKGFRYTPKIDVKDETLQSIIKLGLPIFLGQLVFSLNTIVDRNFASGLQDGTMAALKYANQLNLFVITIFVISITTAIFPTLTKLFADREMDEFKGISKTSINTVLMFVLPIATAFFILAPFIVEIVYMRGQFDSYAVEITSNALMVYAFAIPGVSMNEILNKQFYAIKDTKTPVFSSAISLGINIVLNFIFVEKFGYVGLCASTAIANTVLAVILYTNLRRKIGDFGLKHTLSNLLKMLIASLIMGASVVGFMTIFAVFNMNASGNFYNLCIVLGSALIGSVTYFVAIYFMRVSELNTAIDFVKNKIKK